MSSRERRGSSPPRDPAAELTEALISLGFADPKAGGSDLMDALERFAGWENFEERFVLDDQVDRHILSALRAAVTRTQRSPRREV